MSERTEEDVTIPERLIHGGETFTTVEEYAVQLGYSSEKEFIRELGGGKVLDLGSGLGGLAKSAAFKQLPCTVYSVNPRGGKGDRRDEKEATRAYVLEKLADQQSQKKRPREIRKLFGRSRENSEEIIRRVQEAHDRFRVRALAQKLPFKDSSFDLVIDNQSVSKFAGQVFDNSATDEERARFKQVIIEILRVLKPGGKIRIGDQDYDYGEREGTPISWKEQVLKELGIDYQLILKTPMRAVPPFLLRQDGRMVMGAEIRKK